MFLLLIYFALATYGFVRLLRAWGPIQRLVVRGTKPWACDVCLSFWIAGTLGLQALIMHHHLRPAVVEGTLVAMAIPGLVQLLLAWTAAQVPQESMLDNPEPAPSPAPPLRSLLRSTKPKEFDFRDPDRVDVTDAGSGARVASFRPPGERIAAEETACLDRARVHAGPEHSSCAFAVSRINVKGGRVYDNTCRKLVLDEIPDVPTASTSGT